MRRVVVFTLALATCLAPLVAISDSNSPAAEDKEGAKLALETDYLFWGVDVAKQLPAHWIRLNVTLGAKEGGTGTLEIDPNTAGLNAFGDLTTVTEIGTKSVNVTLEAIQRDDPAKKGRRLYAIKGEDLQGRLFLVSSPKEAGPHRLVIGDKDGSLKYVFPLKDQGKPK
jgi:hypothetical protein